MRECGGIGGVIPANDRSCSPAALCAAADYPVMPCIQLLLPAIGGMQCSDGSSDITSRTRGTLLHAHFSTRYMARRETYVDFALQPHSC